MCSRTAHDRQQPKYVDDSRSGGGKAIPNNATTAALKSPGATLNSIGFWIKHFQYNSQEILIMYNDSMIELFKQIPNMEYKPFSPDKKHQFLLTGTSGS